MLFLSSPCYGNLPASCDFPWRRLDQKVSQRGANVSAIVCAILRGTQDLIQPGYLELPRSAFKHWQELLSCVEYSKGSPLLYPAP